MCAEITQQQRCWAIQRRYLMRRLCLYCDRPMILNSHRGGLGGKIGLHGICPYCREWTSDSAYVERFEKLPEKGLYYLDVGDN
jgi:hypothetical protein